MAGEVFVDTNVLVYARDDSEPKKRPLAEAWMAHLWSTRRGRLSYQVLQEFYVTVTEKLRPGLDAETARQDIRLLLAWQPVTVDGSILEGAWTLQDRQQLSWWDTLIVSAAQRTGCAYVLTEDLQHDQVYGGVRVVNPFRRSPGQLDASG